MQFLAVFLFGIEKYYFRDILDRCVVVVFFSRGLRLLNGEGPPDTKDLANQMTRLPFAKRLSSTLALGYTDAR